MDSRKVRQGGWLHSLSPRQLYKSDPRRPGFWEMGPLALELNKLLPGNQLLLTFISQHLPTWWKESNAEWNTREQEESGREGRGSAATYVVVC